MARTDVLRAGDMLRGYRLLEDFRVVGAGLSEWTFAEQGGRIYFVKRFLSPTYPDDAAPGSPRTKARKRERCAAFEAHHRGIQVAMAPLTTYGGNLIATLDFFREGAKYYKVTEKVDLAGLAPGDVARLAFPAQLVLLKTVAHSLKILHDLKIVHSDLKPSNVLIKRTELGYTTKLIDFDSSYIVGTPPPPEEIVGTMTHYSPELVRYIQGAAHPGELTQASDIFALGLIYTEYLTGSLPPFDPAYPQAAIAALHGQRLRLATDRVPESVRDLVERMMLLDPAARPTVTQAHATLMRIRTTRTTPGRFPAPPRPPIPLRSPPAASGTPSGRPAAAPSTASGLRGKGLGIAGKRSKAPTEGTPEGPAPTARPRGPGLLGRLVSRIDERRSR
ncbi:MAG TPA: protein kinase [Intrasporangium sp.]|uniref:protein kinase domain-containing protein n=1 Tax=Intrasporangium sp. TaxID=1925024 RepID=UPI002B475DEF|nr:protein kinase [Intrasporangium sp.]HKX66471.1 protein kinase [Intrasporangium sp.]